MPGMNVSKSPAPTPVRVAMTPRRSRLSCCGTRRGRAAGGRRRGLARRVRAGGQCHAAGEATARPTTAPLPRVRPCRDRRAPGRRPCSAVTSYAADRDTRSVIGSPFVLHLNRVSPFIGDHVQLRIDAALGGELACGLLFGTARRGKTAATCLVMSSIGLLPAFVSKRFEDLVKASGLPKIRLHDVRHTACSLMLAAGVQPKVVQEMAGHSTVSITLGIYGHTTPSMGQRSRRSPFGKPARLGLFRLEVAGSSARESEHSMLSGHNVSHRSGIVVTPRMSATYVARNS